MIDKIKGLLVKYKSVVLYLIFGVATTLVNIIAFWFLFNMLAMETVPSNVTAWIISCLFAYVTNRIWVFESKVRESAGIIKEVVSFFACRLGTLLVETVFMYIFIDVLGFNALIIKFIANVIVVILNYVASKLIIFTKKND